MFLSLKDTPDHSEASPHLPAIVQEVLQTDRLSTANPSRAGIRGLLSPPFFSFFCLGGSATKGHCFTASVHLQPAPRRDGVNGGAGRVSPAANCAAVTGEGKQLNPRAGGQAARQTRLNEWETINNSGEEAVVNKMMAPKVKVLPATGQSEGGKGGSLRRGIDRNGVLQPGVRNLLLFPLQL